MMATLKVPVRATVYVVVVADDEIVEDVMAALEARNGDSGAALVAGVTLVRQLSDLDEVG